MRLQRYLLQPATILCVTVGLTLPAHADSFSLNQDLRNFQKVNDHVYRGAQPTAAGFKELAQRGIKTVVDLRSIGEHSQTDEKKIVTELGMRYISMPMYGMATPKDDQVAAVLSLMNDTSSGPIFIHCKRGADRTGTVVAVYRISHDGWENKRALHEAKSYGMSPFERALQHYVTRYKFAADKPTLAVAAPVSTVVAAPVSTSAEQQLSAAQ